MICNKCNENKPSDEFSRRSDNHGRLRGQCKVCMATADRTRYPKVKTQHQKATKLWKTKNPDKARAISRRGTRVYYNRNKDYYIAMARERTVAQRAQAPSWLTKHQRIQIRTFYEDARRLTRNTGTSYTVDHIWPIKGKNSCGLHVPWNLQIMTRSSNASKSNHEPMDT